MINLNGQRRKSHVCVECGTRATAMRSPDDHNLQTFKKRLYIGLVLSAAAQRMSKWMQKRLASKPSIHWNPLKTDRCRLSLAYESSQPPEGESEKKLAAVFAEVLGVACVGRDDSFFDLRSLSDGHAAGVAPREYDRGWKFAESQGAFDILFINGRGELTEGGRTNLFLRIGDVSWTPLLSSEVLSGIMRSVLLEDEQFGASERPLFAHDLLGAEQILLRNSLRGCMETRLVTGSKAQPSAVSGGAAQ